MKLDKLFEFIGVKIATKPEGVDKDVWAVIPGEVKGRWDRFSPQMQQHIVTCCTPQAEHGAEQMLDVTITAMFGDGNPSAAIEAPKIPVRLPNPRIEGGVSNEVYDLTDILKIDRRNPANVFERVNPTTNDFFELKDVIPDQAVLQNVLQARNSGSSPRNS